MRTHLSRFARRLQAAKRAAALALAIALSVVAWEQAREPARILVADNGERFEERRGWIQIVIMIAAALLSYALAPKPVKPKPASLAEFDVPQSKEGQHFSWIFGTCFVRDATVASWGNLRSKPIKAKGGKK